MGVGLSGGGTRRRRRRPPRVAPGHNTIASPQKGFGSTSPKPRLRPRTQQPFLDPYARAAAEVLPGFSASAAALQQAIMGQAGYEVGRVRNRQSWQEGVLKPFEGMARNAYGQQSAAVSGLGEALANAQRHLGESLQGNLGAKLADIQAPGAAQDQIAGQQGRLGEGAAGAIQGLSGAEVRALQSIGDAYGTAAAGLPKIAGLAGDAAAHDITQTAANQYATQMAENEAQLQRDLLQNQHYWNEFDYQQGQDKIANQQNLAELGLKYDKEAYDRGQDAQNMAYKWATLDARNKAALLSDKRSAQRIFISMKRLGLTAQNQSYNQWLGQERLAVSQANAQTSALNAGKPIFRGSPSTGIGIYDPFTGQQIGGSPAQPKPAKPLSAAEKRANAKFRAYARSTANDPRAKELGIEATIKQLMEDPDAGPMEIWGPVVAASFGLTPDLPKNLKKYPPIRAVQLAAKLGMDIDFDNNRAPTRQEYNQALAWLGRQYQRLFPKGKAAAKGGYQTGGGNSDLASLWIQAGGDPRVADVAAAIAMGESFGRPNARLVSSVEDSRGLWQINTRAHPWAANLNLNDPLTNARAAVRVFNDNNHSFQPWSAYTNGRYRQYLHGQQQTASASGGAWEGSQPIAQHIAGIGLGFGLTVASEKRDRKMTASGGVSDHWVGSKNAYAYDIAGSVQNMDRAASAILRQLGIRWNGGSIVRNITRGGYRLQILYRTNVGGNHYDHIHIGVRRV